MVHTSVFVAGTNMVLYLFPYTAIYLVSLVSMTGFFDVRQNIVKLSAVRWQAGQVIGYNGLAQDELIRITSP